MKTISILTRACLQTLECRRMFNFGPAVDYAAGSTPYSTVVADLNGDTRPDIAVANYTSGNVSVLLGNANGTFQAAQSSATRTAGTCLLGSSPLRSARTSQRSIRGRAMAIIDSA